MNPIATEEHVRNLAIMGLKCHGNPVTPSKVDLLLSAVFVRSPLKTLRAQYPEANWRAVRDGFGWRYEGDNGWSAQWYAHLAPRYDGDDDSFISRLHVRSPDGQTVQLNA